MSLHRFKLQETVYFDAEVSASTRTEALAELQEAIENGAAEDYSVTERDSTALSLVDEDTDIEKAYRSLAHEHHHDEGVIEIDDYAQVNVSEDGGAYVQAWVWVSDQDIKEGEDE